MKTCLKCHTEKPLTEFYVHKQMSDGHLNKCKACAKADVAERENRLKSTNLEWYESELERHRIKAARHRAAGGGKNSGHVRSNWRKRNPEKSSAHKKVSIAIANGKIQKAPCEVCGNTESQAHHDDYSKPLDVRWLCAEHHSEHHREVNRQRRLKRFQENAAK